MKIGVVTLFPEMFTAIAEYGISGRAVSQGLVSLQLVNPRVYADDRHGTVDDKPFGGGPGMVMKVPPLRAAIAQAKQQVGTAEVVYLSPQGEPLSQAMLAQWARQPALVLVAGRYEGIDERVIEHDIDREVSLGDFVLSGGELPAMALIDGIVRLLPGALGDPASAQSESFTDGMLEYPQYTRPHEVDDQGVPDVLLSGNHEEIRRWRKQQALVRTAQRRPDLLAKLDLDEEARLLLAAYDGPQQN